MNLLEDIVEDLGADFVDFDSPILIKRRKRKTIEDSDEKVPFPKPSTNGEFGTTPIKVKSTVPIKRKERKEAPQPSKLERIVHRMQGGKDNINRLRIKKESLTKVKTNR